MESIQIHAKVQKNGVLILDNLPISEGEDVSVTVNYPTKEKKKKLTGSALRQSGLIGIWKNRDLPDSSEFARQLRSQSQYRHRIPDEDS